MGTFSLSPLGKLLHQQMIPQHYLSEDHAELVGVMSLRKELGRRYQGYSAPAFRLSDRTRRPLRRCVRSVEAAKAIGDARYQADKAAQTAAYEAANAQIMDLLPGIPLAHPVPSLAFKADIHGYPASPVQDEVYNVITIGD